MPSNGVFSCGDLRFIIPRVCAAVTTAVRTTFVDPWMKRASFTQKSEGDAWFMVAPCPNEKGMAVPAMRIASLASELKHPLRSEIRGAAKKISKQTVSTTSFSPSA